MRDQALEIGDLLKIELHLEMRHDAQVQAAFLFARDARHAQPDGIRAGNDSLAGLVLGPHLDPHLDERSFLEIGINAPRLVLRAPVEQLLQLPQRLRLGGCIGTGRFQIADQRSGERARGIAPRQDWILVGGHESNL